MKLTLSYNGKSWNGAYANSIPELLYVLKEIFRESGGVIHSVEYISGKYVVNGSEVYDVVVCSDVVDVHILSYICCQ